MPNYTLQGHRDSYSSRTTKCPGDMLYQEIKSWSNYPGSKLTSTEKTTASTINKHQGNL